jgi:hypothetical protein
MIAPGFSRVCLLLLSAVSCDAFLSVAPSKPTLVLDAFQTSTDIDFHSASSRREILSTALFVALALSPISSNALDMEAFTTSQVNACQQTVVAARCFGFLKRTNVPEIPPLLVPD